MDFNEYLLFNYAATASACFTIVITCCTVLYKLRSRWPINVKCWFCNSNVKIWRNQWYWWKCSNCEQYNGFLKDGDYRYEIPEQYRKVSRETEKNYSYCQLSSSTRRSNGLCNSCNKNQGIKLLEYRKMENHINVNNAKEIKELENIFENKYPLCSSCKTNVEITLQKQSQWLMQYKMLVFKDKPLQEIFQKYQKIENISRILLSILASMSVYYADLPVLSVSGIILQIFACLAAPPGKKNVHTFPLVGWILLACAKCFSSSKILKLMNLYTVHNYPSEDDYMYRYFIITLGSIIAISNLNFCKTQKPVKNQSLSFKRLESSNKSLLNESSLSEDNGNSQPYFNEPSNKSEDSKHSIDCFSPVNVTESLITPKLLQLPIPTKTAEWSYTENRSTPLSSLSPKFSSHSPLVDNKIFLQRKSEEENHYFDEMNLNCLSIGSRQKLCSSNLPKVFETKIYRANSLEIFNKNKYLPSRRSILAMPKLKSVTQTSWVAGGYWHSGTEMNSLSRSSSQSSGLGSLCSNNGHSREPSVHDFDQGSVSTESVYKQFVTPEIPTNVLQRNSSVPTKKSCYLHESSTSGSEIEYNNDLPNYKLNRDNTHYNRPVTIVANPIWLSLLLCVSLVFNSIVLCTILMRS